MFTKATLLSRRPRPQSRQRAPPRTNTLVSLGAATFVAFAARWRIEPSIE